jgi:hypothetical protein
MRDILKANNCNVVGWSSAIHTLIGAIRNAIYRKESKRQ